MSNSTSVHPLISSLINDGKVLANLLQEAKKQDKKKTIHAKETEKQDKLNSILANVTILLKNLENPQLPSSCPETVILKVLDKIQATLEKLIKFDPKNAIKYEDLAETVTECISNKQSSQMVSDSLPRMLQGGESAIFTEHGSDDSQLIAQFIALGEKEKKCLICFCLFSPGKVVKKREPIHLWISLNLIDDTTEGVKMLDTLVAVGFVERTIGNKKLCNRYKLNESVRFGLIQELGSRIDEQRSLCIITQEPQEQPSKTPTVATFARQLTRLQSSLSSRENQGGVDMLGTLVLNRSENTLNARTSDQLSKRKSSIKVLHLGSWDHDHKRYIMVEDMDALKGIIKPMGQLTFLSLQGISGIVELPDLVYKLENLKVLDLRACPNLESLPEGIESLRKLTQLDLSECYLLGHIPSGITSLTQLRVLKGFVINPGEGNGNGTGTQGHNALLSASISELSNLKELIKLTIRTRRMNFPTSEDFDALCKMVKLASLRIAWVWSSVVSPSTGASGRFPASLKKVELQAAPENTMSRLLRLISEDTHNSLEKLYVRGGRLWDLGMEMHYFAHVHTVRLRYLPELRIDWDQFKEFFPKLTRLEVAGCPNLIFFPYDENGVWEETY